MSTLSPGIWEVTYEDDYHDGEYSEKWRLTHHPTMKGCFKVEKSLLQADLNTLRVINIYIGAKI